MTKEKLTEIKHAKAVLCSYCESDECEWCIANRITIAAEVECEYDDESYIRSSTNGDYSPSNPWDAPGMSMSDFI